MFPPLYGLYTVEHRFYIDDQDAAERIIALRARAKDKAREFFGSLIANPTYIICTTPECDDLFRIEGAGFAKGQYTVFLGSRGLRQDVMTHELIHSEFAARVDIEHFPPWFIEGLAVYLSLHPDLLGEQSQDHVETIRSLETLDAFYDFFQNAGGNFAYIVSGYAVKEIAQEFGDDGLRALIRKTDEIADFGAALEYLEETKNRS